MLKKQREWKNLNVNIEYYIDRTRRGNVVCLKSINSMAENSATHKQV